jgi:hypothetical protein
MVRRTLVAVAVVFLVVGFAATNGFSQGTSEMTAVQQVDAKVQAERAALDAIAQDRAAFVAALVDRWRGSLPDGGEELESLLLRAPAERVLAASQARDFDSVRGAVSGRGPIGNIFGSTTGDLVFTPVAPCRLFDTRSAAAGILTAGVIRTFGVNGTLTGQGGNAAGCGVPVDPLAVVVNLAAVSPAGAGNLRAWAYSDPVPTAVVLNYNPTSTSPALSNMVVIPVCYGCGTGLDISLRADVSDVHAVGDVVGYFLFPLGLPATHFTTFAGVSVASANTTLDTLSFTPAHNGSALVTGSAWCNIGTPGDNVIIGFGETIAPFGDNAVAKNNGTGNAQVSLTVHERISLTAGTPVTITLAGRNEAGSGSENCSGQLTATELY